MKRINIIVVVLLVIAAGLFFIYNNVYNKAHPDFENLEADFNLPASELFEEFILDSEKASAKYNGKMLQLSGEVKSIEEVDSLVIAVFVFNEGMFGDEGVRCTFLKENSDGLTDVSSFAGKDIKGFCAGYNDVDVILEKCSIIMSK